MNAAPDEASGLRSGDRIDLWLASPDAPEDSLIDRYNALMTNEERAQANRFYFSRDRRSYVVTRALVRTALSRYATVHPSEWAFVTDRYGRPQIAVDDPLAKRLVFNVSHTAGLIALVVRSDWRVGVDAENVRARTAVSDIADHCCSAFERHALAALPPALRHERFLEYWTLKEAYAKARGKGLSIPLEHLSVEFSGKAINVAIDPLLNDDPSRWCFWQFRFGSEHVIALCAERASEKTPLVTTALVVPLRSEVELTIVPFRTTGATGDAGSE